ncbi:STAS domain-containing protein [Candidatus Protochlamydia phocaeensis]|uniref:STAS domain-containing protein n=1 Tax=Candidatus Protochlamydia phocaeensis TaxID=1414722 RepID=UPI000837B11F|nr:STAS domain-containing protein [Candidatus Protochlamydia phocaeensis]
MEKKFLGDVLYIKPQISFLDSRVSKDLKNQIIQEIESGNKRLLLDLSDMEMIDSGGLGGLIGVYKALENKGSLHLYGLNAKVTKIFRMTGVLKLFPSFSSLDEALQF